VPKTTELRTYTYRFYTYDVWGNEKDGWEVNDVFRSSGTIELPAEPHSDRELISWLKGAGWIKENIRFSNVEVEGEPEHTLYISYKGKPEFELRAEE